MLDLSEVVFLLDVDKTLLDNDRFAVDLTEPGIANYIRRYQARLAARQQDLEALRRHYQGTAALILSIIPTATVNQLVSIITRSPDNIDDLSPMYAKSLGAGRINCLSAVKLALR